ncbi:MAG: fatty acid desaturase [Leptospiraceae bacterium]|nr:fatty acid desaturase [Leptospiraceae bacterium]MDW8305587.1 fatty acid desaturase [Leptospiraceae bacterium]
MESRRRENRERARKISRFIRREERRLKLKYPFLRYQNVLGLSIFLFSAGWMLLASWLYWVGIIPTWCVVITNALAASLLHELEHDLIHGLYFKGRFLEKLLMYSVWVLRGNTPNPFYRRKIHLLHHRESGQFSDIEEQMIGNGMKWGIRRLLTMLDHNLSFLLNARRVAKRAKELDLNEMAKASFPVMWFFYAGLYGFISIQLLLLFGQEQPSFMPYLEFFFYVYVLPNFIRQGSLQIVSSNMHYFGDILPGKDGLFEQTQILRPFWLWPLQLFCFNFGTTHSLHHFVVHQPFYLRQMVAIRAIPYMIRQGIRHNDTASILRANRYLPEVG